MHLWGQSRPSTRFNSTKGQNFLSTSPQPCPKIPTHRDAFNGGQLRAMALTGRGVWPAIATQRRAHNARSAFCSWRCAVRRANITARNCKTGRNGVFWLILGRFGTPVSRCTARQEPANAHSYNATSPSVVVMCVFWPTWNHCIGVLHQKCAGGPSP